MKTYTLTLCLLLACFFNGLYGQPCYQNLFIKGKEYLADKDYQKAFEHFIVARNCWDVKEDSLDYYIDITSTTWTNELDSSRIKADSARVNEVRLKEDVEDQRKIAVKSATINKSYVEGYKSQLALGKNKPNNAFAHAYEARKIIERYNRDTTVIDTLEVSPFIIEAFGNAVFALRKKTVITGLSDIMGFGLSPSNDRFYTIGRGWGIKIWSIDGSLIDFIETKKSDYILSANFSENGDQLIACFKGRESILWKENQRPHAILKSDTSLVQGLFLKDNRILTIDRKGLAQIWNDKGIAVDSNKIGSVPLIEVQLNSEKNIAFFRSAYQVSIWKMDEPNVNHLPVSPSYVYGMELPKNKSHILTISAAGASQLWNIKDGNSNIAGHHSPILTAAFNNQKQEYLTGTENGVIRLLNYEGKESERMNPLSHSKPVRKVLFSPNGNYGFSVATDSIYRVFGKENFEGKLAGAVVSASFSPDSEKFLISSDDNLAKLWSSNGNLLMNMPLGAVPFQSIFDVLGDRIISVTKTGIVYISFMPEVVYKKTKPGEIKINYDN